jgi:small subunit ribosomal protein S5
MADNQEEQKTKQASEQTQTKDAQASRPAEGAEPSSSRFRDRRGSRPPFRQQGRGGGNERGERRSFRGGDRGGKGGRGGRTPRQKEEEESQLHSEVITVKRITRVVKGGKRMRFAALVVAGDKAGSVGFGFKKGLDYQDAVKKATKQASKNLLQVNLNEAKSISFPTEMKFKAARIFLKPAFTGTGLIAGGYIRPVLELAGIENIYSKIIGSRNKVTGVQATFEALKKYSQAK